MPEDTRTPGERAYAVWYRHTFPLAVNPASYSWQLLEPATRALWDAVAQAVLAGAACAAPHAPSTLAALLARVDALAHFVGLDAADHTPLDEAVTLEDRLRTLDTAVELMQGQLAEVLALLKGKTHG
jgi:hypothetical protein